MRYPQGGSPSGRRRRRVGLTAVLLVVAVTAAVVAAASAKTSSKSATVKVGLITKDATNPFFVKMHQGASAQAKMLDSLTAAASSDVEVQSAEPEQSPAERSGGGAQQAAA